MASNELRNKAATFTDVSIKRKKELRIFHVMDAFLGMYIVHLIVYIQSEMSVMHEHQLFYQCYAREAAIFGRY